MKVAILSDTHGKASTVRAALALASQRGAEFIVHCGDIDDADTVRLFPASTHFVLGNCDDPEEIETAVNALGATFHPGFGFLELEDRKIAFVHGDDQATLQDLENSGAFDFVFYGHTHVAKEHRKGRTRVINPGALYRAAMKTFVILDLPEGTIETVVVDG